MAIQTSHGQDIELAFNEIERAVEMLRRDDFHLLSDRTRDLTVKRFKNEYRFLYNEALEDLKELQLDDLAVLYGLPV